MPKTKSSASSTKQKSESKKEHVRRSKVKAEPVPWESATTGLTLGQLPKDAEGDMIISASTMTNERLEAILVYFQKIYLQQTGERMSKDQLRFIREKLKAQEEPVSVASFVSSTIAELTGTATTTIDRVVKSQININGGMPKPRSDIENTLFPCKICNRPVLLSQLPFHEALCVKNQPPGAPGYTPEN